MEPIRPARSEPTAISPSGSSVAGFACLRFDPYGTGDSGGDEHAPNLPQHWIDDVGLATAELQARSGASATVLIGLRLGRHDRPAGR